MSPVGREAPDLSFVHAAADEIAKNAPDDAMVIIESTCPVGTTASIEARFRELGRMTDQMGFAYCPERVLPGNMIHELRQNDRIVGGLDRIANKRSAAFYRLFVEGDIVETDASTAEFCKLVENSFRDVNIAFANEDFHALRSTANFVNGVDWLGKPASSRRYFESRHRCWWTLHRH